MSDIKKALEIPGTRKVNKLFAAPTKNQTAAHPFMPAGDDYGVGKAQPIGMKPGKAESCVPKGAACLPLK